MRTEPIKIVAVVEDDEAIRNATGGLVRSLGWHVRLFDSASMFLQSAGIAQTDCLVSDVRMPNMSGIEMHNRLVQAGYSLTTIFITAFTTPALNAKLQEPGVVAILEKPIDPAALADCLTRALGLP